MSLKKLIRVPVYCMSIVVSQVLLVITLWPLAISLWEWLDDTEWCRTYYALLHEGLITPLYLKIKEDLNV